MKLKTLFFSEDPKQALRIKRLLSANIAYFFVGIMTTYAIYFGYLPSFPKISILIVPLIPNLVFYSLIRSNLNLHFKDPSLTVPQTVYAIFVYMYLIYFANEVRGAFLMLALSVPIGIALRVRPKKLFWISLLPLLILGSIILWQYFVISTPHKFSIAFLEWFALAGGVGWLTVDSTYMARKRQETIEINRRLEAAAQQNILLIENLTRQKEIAESANQSNIEKSRLLAAANHDLRQPLHALSLFAAQLKECKTEKDRVNIAEKIEASVSNINELFSDLLDISKLDAGVVTPNISNISVQSIFDKLKNTFEEIAKKKSLQLHFVNTSARVWSENILLERILMNLISNALKYTDQGKILVGCRKRKDKWIIQILDTGRGIDSSYFTSIFKEYTRIPQDNDKQTPGLGLGLAIVDKLCLLLEHKISLSSIVNRGSCFSVELKAAEKILSSTPLEIKSHYPAESTQTILFIDDDAQVQDAMKGLITTWGYKIILAADQDEALREISQLPSIPNLIISDVSLGNNKNGIDAIVQIRKALNSNIPAFLITGDTDSEILQKAKSENIPLFHKPLKPISLRALMNKFL